MKMISEGSCDTEDWSNDAENAVNYILIIFYNKISQYYCFCDQINVFGELKHLWIVLQDNLTNLNCSHVYLDLQ